VVEGALPDGDAEMSRAVEAARPLRAT
jgi:hypothetical protein